MRTLKIQRTAWYSRVSGYMSAQLAHEKNAPVSAWHASGYVWEEVTQKTLAPPLGQKKNRNSGLRHLMIYMRVSNERNLLLITFVINNNNNLIIMKYYDYYEILYVIQYEWKVTLNKFRIITNNNSFSYCITFIIRSTTGPIVRHYNPCLIYVFIHYHYSFIRIQLFLFLECK